MTNLKNKNNLNEFTKAYTDKNDKNYLVNKYNLSDEVENTTDAFNEMTDEQINDAIQDTFIINNNGVLEYEFIGMLINEGLTVTKKDNKYLVKDFANNVINIIENGFYLEIFDINGNSEKCDINDLEHIKFATFSALEGEYKNDTIDYVNEYLLNCETHHDDLLVNVKGYMENVEIVDVIGVVEEKGRIFIGLEIVTNDFPFGHIVHVSFINAWEHVYKDEMIEIIEVLSNLISAQLKTDLGLKDNILDDVKYWLKEQTNGDQQEEINILDHLITYGTENVAPNHLIYNDDIQSYYKEHREEINNIVEEETGYSIDDAIEDLDAFEVVINNVGGLDSELEFENSHELENSELCWFVWLAFERVAYEYLGTLESK